MSRRVTYLVAAAVVVLLAFWGLGPGHHGTTTVTASAGGTAMAVADSALVRVAFEGDPSALQAAVRSAGADPEALKAGPVLSAQGSSYRVYTLVVQPAQAEALVRALATVPGARSARYRLQAGDLAQAERQAYAAAVATAKARAEALAAAGDLHLGRLISIRSASGAGVGRAGGGAPLRVRVAVAVTYSAR
jgi:hypothetical protein